MTCINLNRWRVKRVCSMFSGGWVVVLCYLCCCAHTVGRLEEEKGATYSRNKVKEIRVILVCLCPVYGLTWFFQARVQFSHIILHPSGTSWYIITWYIFYSRYAQCFLPDDLRYSKARFSYYLVFLISQVSSLWSTFSVVLGTVFPTIERIS